MLPRKHNVELGEGFLGNAGKWFIWKGDFLRIDSQLSKHCSSTSQHNQAPMTPDKMGVGVHIAGLMIHIGQIYMLYYIFPWYCWNIDFYLFSQMGSIFDIFHCLKSTLSYCQWWQCSITFGSLDAEILPTEFWLNITSSLCLNMPDSQSTANECCGQGVCEPCRDYSEHL